MGSCTNFISYLNPFSAEHNAMRDFKMLQTKHKAVVCIVTGLVALVALVTLPIFGLLAILVFRSLVYKFKPDINSRNEDKFTAQDLTAVRNQKSENIDIQDNDGEMALTLAAREGKAETVKLLLEKGANANIGNLHNVLPLHLAAEKGDFETIELLSGATKEINAQDIEGRTILYYAVKSTKANVVEFFLDRGADANISKDTTGKQPLHLAAELGVIEIVQLLVPVTENINARDKKKSTALSLALYKGNRDVVKYLLEQDADANIANYLGRLPLHYAVFNNDEEIVRLLLPVTTNINAKSLTEDTAYRIARLQGYNVIADILLNAGADSNI